MGGQFGNTQVTTQGLTIVKIIDNERLVLIKGAVPGPNGGLVTIRKS
jgi:large subunit ribosomal protein L3